MVPAASTSFTMDNLQESSAYKIQVSPMIGGREGSPVLVTARTCGFSIPITLSRNVLPNVSRHLYNAMCRF